MDGERERERLYICIYIYIYFFFACFEAKAKQLLELQQEVKKRREALWAVPARVCGAEGCRRACCQDLERKKKRADLKRERGGRRGGPAVRHCRCFGGCWVLSSRRSPHHS